MADFYSDLGKMASELLSPTSQNGLGQGSVVLSREIAGSEPVNPWEPVQTETKTETLKAAVRGVDKRLVGTEVGETVLLASDRQAICAVPVMDYTAGDTLIVDDKPVHIIAVENIPAAGIRAAVKFYIRG